MSDMPRKILWDRLVAHLDTAKFGDIKRTQRDLDDVSDTGQEASTHSDISRYNPTAQERKTVRALDHHRCFVTNVYSHRSEVAYLLDSCNAENRALVSARLSVGVET
jgi:hypothetical protein